MVLAPQRLLTCARTSVTSCTAVTRSFIIFMDNVFRTFAAAPLSAASEGSAGSRTPSTFAGVSALRGAVREVNKARAQIFLEALSPAQNYCKVLQMTFLPDADFFCCLAVSFWNVAFPPIALRRGAASQRGRRPPSSSSPQRKGGNEGWRLRY